MLLIALFLLDNAGVVSMEADMRVMRDITVAHAARNSHSGYVNTGHIT